MFSGLSFRSVFVFSINLLILSGFTLTSLHLTEASLSVSFFGLFILLYEQLSKNTTKCLLLINIHIFSSHFAINLFYLHNLKA